MFWAFYNFNNQTFALCGKTIKSLRRNVLEPVLPVLYELGFKYKQKISENFIKISYYNKENYFYTFGGKDESSASLIQGMTLAGVFFDEAALMPKSFVEQALARCSVRNSKFWFNCNPQSTSHWFYREWILPHKSRNAFLISFRLEDNPSLSPEVICRYRKLYTGSFYRRFIEGEWCSSQGLVYPAMARSDAFYSRGSLPVNLIANFRVSCDYGVVNPMSCGLWGYLKGIWYRIEEYYYNSKTSGITRTDEEHLLFIKKLTNGRKIDFIIVDPSAAGFISLLRKHMFAVIPANNKVLEGINRVGDALVSGKIKICDNCLDSIHEFSIYRWQENKDVPVKENDHAMDDIRYFVMSLENENDGDSFFAAAAKR
jgi:PBSX family phage terminase large subunit